MPATRAQGQHLRGQRPYQAEYRRSTSTCRVTKLKLKGIAGWVNVNQTPLQEKHTAHLADPLHIQTQEPNLPKPLQSLSWTVCVAFEPLRLSQLHLT